MLGMALPPGAFLPKQAEKAGEMNKFAGAGRSWWRSVLVCVGAVAILLLLPTTSATASTTFINMKPTPGQVVTALPVNIEVDADDSQYSFDLYDPYSEMFLNGSRLNAGQKLLGHWEGEYYFGYEWVIDDATIMQMFDPNFELPDGPYTVVARAKNQAGETTETTWDFTLAVPPTAASLTPAANTPYQMPPISAVLNDNIGGGIASVLMRVDGALVPATFDPATRKVSYTPTTPLADNAAHTVELELTDTNGNTGTRSWTFNVKTAALAVFTNRIPEPGSTVYIANPTIGATVSSMNRSGATSTACTSTACGVGLTRQGT